MKKFLSILLTLCLLLAPMGALAESGATQLTIDMIELTIGDNDPIELDLSLLLTLLNGDAGQSLSLAVNDAEGNPILAGGLYVAEDGLTGVINGMSSAYRISPEALQEALASIEEELGTPVTLLLTGGGGKYVTNFLRHNHTFDPDMTRKGLALLYRLNSK